MNYIKDIIGLFENLNLNAYEIVDFLQSEKFQR